MRHKRLSAYEQQALKEIHAWKKRGRGWVGRKLRPVNQAFDRAGDAVVNAPGVGWVIQRTVGGLVTLLNDTAQWTIKPEAVYAEYRTQDHEVTEPQDILGLDLWHVDKAVKGLATKYRCTAALEGGGTGFVGLPTIPFNIVALVTLNLRAIGEYGTYCGFDTSTPPERLFAMHVLTYATDQHDAVKSIATAQLTKIAQEAAKKKTWKELERYAFVRIIRQVAKVLGVRLTKAKLAQVAPVVGALVGAGYDTYYTDKVCDAAYHLYRERFLANKLQDPGVIAELVPPPDTFDPGYEVEDMPADEEPPPATTPGG